MSSSVGNLDRTKIRISRQAGGDDQVLVEVDHLAQLCPADAIGLLDGDDLTGLMLWPSAQLLAQFLASHGGGGRLAGARVIELGAGGTGLPGLVAAQFCRSVVLTDNNPSALAVLRANAERNAPSGRPADISVAALAWGEDIEAGDMKAQFDLVVAADVIYDFDAIELIAASIARLLAEPQADSCAIITYTERLTEYRAALAAACERQGLRLAAVLAEQDCEYGETITVLIHSAQCRDSTALVRSWSLDSDARWSLSTI